MNLFSRLARRITGTTSTIALLTDFGTGDQYVAALKAVILRINPKANTVDITHHVEPHSVRQAGYLLWSVYRYFPRGTIFVCVVDPGVGSPRRLLGVRTSDFCFIAPDNMLLDFVLSEENVIESVELPSARSPYTLADVSSTFHGRDILAPVAAHISLGTRLTKVGRTAVVHPVASPFINLDREISTKGEVLHIDQFGNIITNLRVQNAASAPKRIKTMTVRGRRLRQWTNSYVEASDKTPSMIVGSNSLVEIVVNRGSAAWSLRAAVGDIINVVWS
jgi:hypothetical protein